jgi:hypothetical protein
VLRQDTMLTTNFRHVDHQDTYGTEPTATFISMVIYVVFALNALLMDLFRPNLNLTFSGPSNRFLERPSYAIHTTTNA